jgi:DNA-binding CsgD family transcriptional regulator
VSRDWPLLGRAAELDAIAAATATGGGIVLAGAAGVGKTRLARETVAALAPDTRTRWITGTASARSVPLGAFAGVASDFGPDPLLRVREVIDSLIGGADDRTVVAVDDAHLLDDLSAFAVHQLVTRKLATVIMTIRSGEPVPDAITAIWKDQFLERLEVQSLSLEESTGLIEHALDGPVHSRCVHQLWQYTRGNVLYLRHLIDSEVDAGRLASHSGVWMWDGQPRLTPTLAQLVRTRIDRIPDAVRGVLDALAVIEPLGVDVLASVSDADAIAEAELLGLVRIDATARPALVRLAHPIVGEVRRDEAPGMAQLRGRIAAELGRAASTDPRDVVRRTMLMLDSDLSPDPDLLNAATAAAIQLTDMRLAESLAERAVAAGGGFPAKLTHAMALMWQERADETEALFAELVAETSGPLRVQLGLLRALNLAVILGLTTRGEHELEIAADSDDAGVQATVLALRASIDIQRGHSAAAVVKAGAVIADPAADAIATMLAALALVGGLGELGRVDEIAAAADVGYARAESSPEVSHLRLPLAFMHAYVHRLAGALTEADSIIARIRRDTVDMPIEGSWQVSESWHAWVSGLSAISRGALDDAQRLCTESLADLGAPDTGSMRKVFARLWAVGAKGMAGRAAEARRDFEAVTWWTADPDAVGRDPELALARAWVCAAEGDVPQAVSLMRDAAARETGLGRPAWEVLLLQTATQFGDASTADRLAELAAAVQGPRAPTAAAHAAALAAGDGDALLAASRRYEEFGDGLAAADAAAHAVAAHERAGDRPAALLASAVAQRLAAECGGADTPALREGRLPLPITARQREIIALAAHGLSNRDIADRLMMSVRSVEGHLFRASQRLGVNGRDQLIAIVGTD